jgi:hypothetical protein
MSGPYNINDKVDASQLDTAATADSVAQRDATGQLTATNLIAADKIIHDGDTNTAIRFPAADTVTVETAGAERLRVTSTGNVGIGTTSPAQLLTLSQSSGSFFQSFVGDSTSLVGIVFGTPSDIYNGQITYNNATQALSFVTNSTTRMRINSSGNVLIGKTSENITVAGLELRGGGEVLFTRNGDMATFNRLTTDGEVVRFRKNNTPVGSIGSFNSEIYIAGANTGFRFTDGANAIAPTNGDGSNRDDAIDLGRSSVRFNDIYATNGTIQTSDRNEKQDIEELSEAEHRVAVACKGLLRKFRWISSVEEKGDDARIHFGVIAQDLQAAFEAEGLDAGRYAMFIYSDWWEHEVEVPAVEAQEAVYETVVIPAEYDEEGNEVSPETTEQRLVSEAVEGKEAYTQTDTYNSEEEAPEGSVKKSRMGVRYSELLAFIIAGL